MIDETPTTSTAAHQPTNKADMEEDVSGDAAPEALV